MLRGRERFRDQNGKLVWRNKTAGGGAYPRPLCQRWAQALMSGLPSDLRGSVSLCDKDQLARGLERAYRSNAENRVLAASGSTGEAPQQANGEHPHKLALAEHYLARRPRIQFGQDSAPRQWG